MINLFILNETFTNGLSYGLLSIIEVASILCGISVIVSKNPIVSVLFLIGLFLNIAGYLMMLGINFIGLSYLLVYVGAVSILFLFILMLINVRISELITDTNNSIPLAFIIGILFNITLYRLLPSNMNTGDSIFGYNVSSFSYRPANSLSNMGYPTDNIPYLHNNHLSFVTSQIWDGALAESSHITSIGNVIYTTYPIWLILTSIILLLAMVGAIIITIKQKSSETTFKWYFNSPPKPHAFASLPLQNGIQNWLNLLQLLVIVMLVGLSIKFPCLILTKILEVQFLKPFIIAYVSGIIYIFRRCYESKQPNTWEYFFVFFCSFIVSCLFLFNPTDYQNINQLFDLLPAVFSIKCVEVISSEGFSTWTLYMNPSNNSSSASGTSEQVTSGQVPFNFPSEEEMGNNPEKLKKRLDKVSVNSDLKQEIIQNLKKSDDSLAKLYEETKDIPRDELTPKKRMDIKLAYVERDRCARNAERKLNLSHKQLYFLSLNMEPQNSYMTKVLEGSVERFPTIKQEFEETEERQKELLKKIHENNT